MSWTQRIATVVLVVLAALPLSATVCAMACADTATTTAPRHHSGSGSASCEAPARPSTEQHLRGASDRDCSTHDAAVRQPTTTAAARADLAALAAPPTVALPHSTVVAPRNSRSIADDTAPPGTPPPTATPLVLRV